MWARLKKQPKWTCKQSAHWATSDWTPTQLIPGTNFDKIKYFQSPCEELPSQSPEDKQKDVNTFPVVANPANSSFYSANLAPHALHVDNKAHEFPGRSYIPLN